MAEARVGLGEGGVEGERLAGVGDGGRVVLDLRVGRGAVREEVGRQLLRRWGSSGGGNLPV